MIVKYSLYVNLNVKAFEHKLFKLIFKCVLIETSAET